MANQERNRHNYDKIVEAFDALSKGDHPEKLEVLVNRARNLFVDGFQPHTYPESDFGKQVLADIQEYSQLLAKRREVEIAGGKRHITTEDDALQALILAEAIARELLVPLFNEKNEFSNTVFNDIMNLSLSYVDAIVNGVANEYIGIDDALKEKLIAIELAKQGMRVIDSYHAKGLNEDTKQALKRFEEPLIATNKKLMRPFENVATTQKNVNRKERLMERLQEEVTEQDPKGDFVFKPEVIFPIAHGGTEFGVRIANTYEDRGHSAIVYPLMFSMKTRKQGYPWVQHDAKFLGKSLEGQDVLIVEDWVTTGNTLRGILSKVEEVFPREIRVATIKRDPRKSGIAILGNYKFYVGKHSNYIGKKTDSLVDMNKH